MPPAKKNGSLGGLEVNDGLGLTQSEILQIKIQNFE